MISAPLRPPTLVLATDLVRLFLGATLLAFASWTDWEWRRAPNVLWVILLACALLLLGVDAVNDWDAMMDAWPYLAAAPVIALFFFGMWFAGLISGGADAKALMAIAFLLPFPLQLDAWPLLPSIMPGSIAVLGNSLIAVLIVPLGLFAINAANRDFSFPRMFLGRRVPLDKLEELAAWPMERVVDGKVRTAWFPGRSEAPLDETIASLREAHVERVWITPKIPFMIPLLIGFIAAFIAGDLLMGAVAAAIG